MGASEQRSGGGIIDALTSNYIQKHIHTLWQPAVLQFWLRVKDFKGYRKVFKDFRECLTLPGGFRCWIWHQVKEEILKHQVKAFKRTHDKSFYTWNTVPFDLRPVKVHFHVVQVFHWECSMFSGNWIPTSQSVAQTAGQTDECTSTSDSITCHPSSGDKTLSTDLCRDEHPQVWTSHLPEVKHSCWRLVASVHEATRSAVRLQERWIIIRTTRLTSICTSRSTCNIKKPPN